MIEASFVWFPVTEAVRSCYVVVWDTIVFREFHAYWFLAIWNWTDGNDNDNNDEDNGDDDDDNDTAMSTGIEEGEVHTKSLPHKVKTQYYKI